MNLIVNFILANWNNHAKRLQYFIEINEWEKLGTRMELFNFLRMKVFYKRNLMLCLLIELNVQILLSKLVR